MGGRSHGEGGCSVKVDVVVKAHRAPELEELRPALLRRARLVALRVERGVAVLGQVGAQLRLRREAVRPVPVGVHALKRRRARGGSVPGRVERREDRDGALERAVRHGALEPLDDAVGDDARVDLGAVDVGRHEQLRPPEPNSLSGRRRARAEARAGSGGHGPWRVRTGSSSLGAGSGVVTACPSRQRRRAPPGHLSRAG